MDIEQIAKFISKINSCPVEIEKGQFESGRTYVNFWVCPRDSGPYIWRPDKNSKHYCKILNWLSSKISAAGYPESDCKLFIAAVAMGDLTALEHVGENYLE